MTRSKTILKILAVYSIIFVILSSLFFLSSPTLGLAEKAAVYMLLILIFLWIIIGGALMYLFRKPIRFIVRKINMGWKTKFILFCTILALLEEVITVTLTNSAPLFGLAAGAVPLTVSTNYFVVVLLHSVIVFIPMFMCWAWLLSKYDFKVEQVFLLFGLTGVLAEAFVNPQNLITGFFIFVYGLMIFLPAYSIPADRNVKKPNFFHYLIALILPLICAIPVVFIVTIIREALGIVFLTT